MKLFLFLGILSLAVLADAGDSMDNPYYCFATDRTKPQANMHSVITSYEAIRRIDWSTVNPFASLKNRTASRFWYLGRYGIRFPLPASTQSMIAFANSPIIDDIVRNYNSGLTTLCQQDFENIRDFKMDPDFVQANAALIKPLGISELQNIAKRFQDAFPGVLPKKYSQSQYRFRHMNIERSNQSAHAFASGLFNVTEAKKVVYDQIPPVDWLLDSFNNCPLYNASLEDYEVSAFTNGTEVQEMVQEINKKLGFRIPNQLDIDRIMTMWEWCRFGVVYTYPTNVQSPWCAPFSVAHQQIMEYREDVRFYYRHGYGFKNRRLLENLTCGILQDLVTHMRSRNSNDQEVHIFFTFLQEILSTLVSLGGFRDVWEINQFNFAQQGNRQWRTGLFTTFSSNIAVARYDSTDGDHDLVFLVNEKPLLLPGCNVQTGICKLSFIEERLKRFIDANCATSFCSNNK